MSTVSLLGAVALLPLLLLATVVHCSPVALLGHFALVVSLMLLEHLRRCRLLKLPLAVTGSWVLFRAVVLGIILTTLAL